MLPVQESEYQVLVIGPEFIEDEIELIEAIELQTDFAYEDLFYAGYEFNAHKFEAKCEDQIEAEIEAEIEALYPDIFEALANDQTANNFAEYANGNREIFS
jgi:hypothetical protein